MAREKILLTVTTYPLPSRSYDELVCTAGIREDGTWVRIYPMPLSYLTKLKQGGILQTTKYSWIELDLEKRPDDFRPESHSPRDYEFKDLVIGEHLGTERNWKDRKDICLQSVYTNLTQLITDSEAPKNVSLATFKPRRILRFEIEKDTEDWNPVYEQLKQQLSLFSVAKEADRQRQRWIKKIPYKFYYRFEDDAGRTSRLMIEDWEIGALYWKCLDRANGNQDEALEKVRYRYEQQFIQDRDLHLFLGTTKKWHMRRSKNPFVIIGVFYPKQEDQLTLF